MKYNFNLIERLTNEQQIYAKQIIHDCKYLEREPLPGIYKDLSPADLLIVNEYAENFEDNFMSRDGDHYE